MPTATKGLPDALREAMGEARLNQAALADEINVDQGTISRVLAGHPFSRRVGAAIVGRFPGLKSAVADALLAE